jgi:hypothetical protein
VTEENYTPEPVAEEPTARLFLSDSMYDKLKFVALIFLPAMGTFYYTVATLLEWPKTDEVVGIVMAFDALLGILLGTSSKGYKKLHAGKLIGFADVNEVTDEEGHKKTSVVLNYPHDDPEQVLEEIKKQDKITFKVRKFS